MYVVGLTGGIGSGKSAAAQAFIDLGVTVIDADQVAREVVEPGTPALAAIVERYGESILNADGGLDRAQLREKVFADQRERKWLESITHPAIGTTILERLSQPRREGEPPYRILESPLLMETEQKSLADRLLLIDVPIALQVSRTAARDNNSEEQVKAIISAQMSRKDKLTLADDVIDNSGSLQQLVEAVNELHQEYCQLAEAPASE